MYTLKFCFLGELYLNFFYFNFSGRGGFANARVLFVDQFQPPMGYGGMPQPRGYGGIQQVWYTLLCIWRILRSNSNNNKNYDCLFIPCIFLLSLGIHWHEHSTATATATATTICWKCTGQGNPEQFSPTAVSAVCSPGDFPLFGNWKHLIVLSVACFLFRCLLETVCPYPVHSRCAIPCLPGELPVSSATAAAAAIPAAGKRDNVIGWNNRTSPFSRLWRGQVYVTKRCLNDVTGL